jgi:hypothetical protein
MRSVFIFAIILFAFSCSQPETPKEEKTSFQTVNVPNDTVKVTHMDADTSKLLMMGRGSEPGWFCQFYQNKVRFVFDQGNDSIILRGMDFSNQMRMQNGFENFKFSSPKQDTVFETVTGECWEVSGEKRGMQMQIIVGKRVFKGCAWVPN